jgi:hypothetical protein
MSLVSSHQDPDQANVGWTYRIKSQHHAKMASNKQTRGWICMEHVHLHKRTRSYNQINKASRVKLSASCVEPQASLLGLLAPTTYHVATMITVKNGATTTATAVVTTGQKARGPGNFVTANQTLCPKISTLSIFIFNTIFAMMFLHKCPQHDYSSNNFFPCISSSNNFLLNGLPTSFFSYLSFSEPALSPTPPHTCIRSVHYVSGGRQ